MASDYFKDRIVAVYQAYNSAEKRSVALLRLYKKAAAEIESEILLLYAKATETGKLSLTDSHNLKRLRQLEQKIKERTEKLANQTEKTTKESMKQGFGEVYSSISGLSGNGDFTIPNPKLMEQILDTPWRGSTFSKRVWNNQKLLERTLNHELRRGIVQGMSIAQIAVAVDNVMQKGFNAAHRLVRTETMHYLNEANKLALKDAGIKRVQFYAAEDERTCEICGAEHERVYDLGKEPVLPLHPNCRCTLIGIVTEAFAANHTVYSKTPVEYDPSKPFRVDLKNYSAAVNDGISAACKEVARLGQDDNEHLILVDLKTGKNVFYEKGLPDGVGGRRFYEFLQNNSNSRFAFVHNHNIAGSHSETDMRTLLTEKSIPVMIVSRRDGIIYSVERSGEIIKLGDFFEEYPEDGRKILEKHRGRNVFPFERSRDLEVAFVNNLIRDYCSDVMEVFGE